jgi:hypothetical protein
MLSPHLHCPLAWAFSQPAKTTPNAGNRNSRIAGRKSPMIGPSQPVARDTYALGGDVLQDMAM